MGKIPFFADFLENWLVLVVARATQFKSLSQMVTALRLLVQWRIRPPNSYMAQLMEAAEDVREFGWIKFERNKIDEQCRSQKGGNFRLVLIQSSHRPAASLRSASDRSGSLCEPSEPTRQTGFRPIWRRSGETKPVA